MNSPRLSSQQLAQTFERAFALHQQGMLPVAAGLYRQILAQFPSHLDTLQLLGTLELQTGQHEAAVKLLHKAVRKLPTEAGLHCNLGLALLGAGQYRDALVSLDRAIALNPRSVEAHNNRGNVLRRLKCPDEAVASYERALRLRPDFIEALNGLGSILIDLQKPQQALECLSQCLNIAPNHPAALGQRGIALMALQRADEALASFEQAVQFTPGDAEAHYWRGNALLELGRTKEALSSYRSAVSLRPDLAELHYNLANCLVELKHTDEALAAYEQALAIRPDYVEALYNMAGALQELRLHEESIRVLKRLLKVVPEHRYARGMLLHAQLFLADWSDYAESVAAVIHSLKLGKMADQPFAFLAISGDPAEQLLCAQDYTAKKFPAVLPPLCAASPYAHPRLRIAYVSADFREHPLCYLLAGVFEAHDQNGFEFTGIFLNAPDQSEMGQRLGAAFSRTIDASIMHDDEVAALIREMEIDIAVDLTGYTENNRTGIFARRPAPIQINYLGYPGGMGAEYIDYIIADDFVIPEAMRKHYVERVVWLPHCFQGNDGQRRIAEQYPSRAECGLPETGFVFCCFNNIYKITPALFACWMRLLLQLSQSVLWFAADDMQVQHHLRSEAEKHGISPARLRFSPRVPYAEHLARMQHADLFLDTLPFNAGTTASDALWAGLPVLTCSGDSFAGRMAGSLLRAIGLDELITHSLDDYEALALALANDSARLAAIRARLAANRSTQPLFDTANFTQGLERAYQQMWARHQAGLPPDHIGLAG